MLCNCNAYTHEEIEEMIKNGNYATLEDFQDDTAVGTVCGGCLPTVEEIWDKVKNN